MDLGEDIWIEFIIVLGAQQILNATMKHRLTSSPFYLLSHFYFHISVILNKTNHCDEVSDMIKDQNGMMLLDSKM